jgi:hypothetical protein
MNRSYPAAAVVAALALAGASGCRRRPPPEPLVSTTPTLAASAPARPADHALPDEIAEGSEKAFGLPIPRQMRVVGRFDDVVFVTGDVAPELVANYVRQRVLSSHVETGPAKTVFTGVTLRSDAAHTLRVDVISRNGDTDLTVRDETRPPAREGLSEAERWKALGLTPQGTPLDPTHLQ